MFDELDLVSIGIAHEQRSTSTPPREVPRLDVARRGLHTEIPNGLAGLIDVGGDKAPTPRGCDGRSNGTAALVNRQVDAAAPRADGDASWSPHPRVVDDPKSEHAPIEVDGTLQIARRDGDVIHTVHFDAIEAMQKRTHGILLCDGTLQPNTHSFVSAKGPSTVDLCRERPTFAAFGLAQDGSGPRQNCSGSSIDTVHMVGPLYDSLLGAELQTPVAAASRAYSTKLRGSRPSARRTPSVRCALRPSKTSPKR